MNRRILVIDDSPHIAHFLELILGQEGYRVRTSARAMEGLEQIQLFGPDLILLDILLPKVSGWEILAHLRDFTIAPVIVLTALGGIENTIRALDAGADDYITKPFNIDDLSARIRAALRRASMQEGLPSALASDAQPQPRTALPHLRSLDIRISVAKSTDLDGAHPIQSQGMTPAPGFDEFARTLLLSADERYIALN